jgi:beta-fructofuranosidase
MPRLQEVLLLKLVDKWIWDSWFVFDGENFHAFYLSASRALGDPNRRHRNPIVGHAISSDLTNWTVVRDALILSDSPAFDSWTTWTGSVVKGDDGRWWMFYTGTSREDGGDIQSVGAAVSDDLMVWEKLGTEAIVRADARWYEKLDKSVWPDEAWRDPWVFKRGDTWHMLVTARSNTGDPKTRGVLGHATSKDMLNWEVQPPLSTAGSDFGQLEVFQYAEVDGVPILLFCCGWRELSPERQLVMGEQDASYSLAINADFSEIDFAKAEPFLDNPVYAARLVQGRDGGWNLIGFENMVDGEFVGALSDPIPVTADPVLGLISR